MKDRLLLLTVCLLGILCLILLSECRNQAQAQLSLHGMLARICTSEAGWDRPAGPLDWRPLANSSSPATS